MNPAASGRRIMAALGNIDGPTRCYLTHLWMDYAEHLANNVTDAGDVARLFLELGHACAEGTTEADRIEAAFVAIAAELPPVPLNPESN